MTVGTRPRAPRAHARTHATGAVSTALRRILESPRRPARVLAAFPAGIYLEVRTELEPHVIAVVTGDATRLPNAMVITGSMPQVAVGDEGPSATARSRSDGSVCGPTAGGTRPRRSAGWIRSGWPARYPCWPSCATAHRDVRAWRATAPSPCWPRGAPRPRC
ncbi:hypothetical protein ACFQX6_62045 [Streptosporangium lutulentum]